MLKRISESALYYLVWDPKTMKLLARGSETECTKKLRMRVVTQFRDVESRKYIIDRVSKNAPMTFPCLMCDKFHGVRERCCTGIPCGKPCEKWKDWGRLQMKVLSGADIAKDEAVSK